MDGQCVKSNAIVAVSALGWKKGGVETGKNRGKALYHRHRRLPDGSGKSGKAGTALALRGLAVTVGQLTLEEFPLARL
jgi:hypothetical protein